MDLFNFSSEPEPKVASIIICPCNKCNATGQEHNSKLGTEVACLQCGGQGTIHVEDPSQDLINRINDSYQINPTQTSPEECPCCMGTGQVPHDNNITLECDKCDGAGVILDESRLREVRQETGLDPDTGKVIEPEPVLEEETPLETIGEQDESFSFFQSEEEEKEANRSLNEDPRHHWF